MECRALDEALWYQLSRTWLWGCVLVFQGATMTGIKSGCGRAL